MGERSFAEDVKQLGYGRGQTLRGEGILAITKALLQSGVSYVGGYPGAPISHLLDVLADANESLLKPLGIYYELSGSEAAAAALLGASINYPVRGAVTWKSVVGTNVASDALSHVASAGVLGGALVVIGEDYGEGASILQERTHSSALKSSIPLLDPRNTLQSFARFVEEGFGLSEACNEPVFFSIRIRACHMRGTLACRDNVRPAISMRSPLQAPSFSLERINLPPFTYAMEAKKFEQRLPAARRYILERGLNEHRPGTEAHLGIVMQGGLWNTTVRGLHLLGLADLQGRTPVPLMILNAIHPLVPEAAGVQRDEDLEDAGPVGRRHARGRRHRLPHVLDAGALQRRQLRAGLRDGARVVERRGAALQQAGDLGDGRRRLLAQRPHQRRGQRDVQPPGLRAGDPRQLLHVGHGPASQPVHGPQRAQGADGDDDPPGAARGGRVVDPHGGLLRHSEDDRHAARRADDARQGPQGGDRARGVPAGTPAAAPAAPAYARGGGRDGSAAALRCGPGRLHR